MANKKESETTPKPRKLGQHAVGTTEVIGVAHIRLPGLKQHAEGTYTPPPAKESA